MDLLAEEQRARLIPALILYHPSQRVVLRALEIFAARRAQRLPARRRPAAAPRRPGDSRRGPARARARRPGRGAAARRRRRPEPARARDGARRAGGRRLGGRRRPGADRVAARGRRRRRPRWPWRARSRSSRRPRSRPCCCVSRSRRRTSVLVHVARAMGALRSPRFLPALLGMLVQREARAEARAALLALRRGGAGLPRRGARRPRAADRAAPAPAAHDRRCSRRARPRPCSSVTCSRRPRARSATGSCARSTGSRPRRTWCFDVARAAPGRRAARVEAIFRVIHWRAGARAGRARASRAARRPGHELLVGAAARQGGAVARAAVPAARAAATGGEDFKGMYRGLRSTRRARAREQPRAAREPARAAAARAGAGDRRRGARRLAARPRRGLLRPRRARLRGRARR